MKQKVYIETSVLSYLSSRLSEDRIISAHQLITQYWWKKYSRDYELYVSEIVLREAGRGNSHEANRRLHYAAQCNILPITDNLLTLTEIFMRLAKIPPKQSEDILHITMATVHNIDYLLSWNCAHIANAQMQKKLSKIAQEAGYELPILCTPLELNRSMV